MDEYEPITGELRAYVRRATSTSDNCWWTASDTQNVRDLCDNIDSVHAQLERENARLREKVRRQGVQLTEVQDALERRNNGELKRHWQKELDRLKVERDSMAAALDAAQGEHAYAPESHYVMLPKDAEGVPIHVGDVLDGYGKTIEVVELRHGRSGWVLISRDGNGYADTFAFTHHHAPTVEDVLREFGDWYAHTKGGCDEDGIVAEYAAKLRLAGEK